MPVTRLGRDALLALFAVPAGVGVAFLGGSDASWFPQQHAHTFFAVKGVVGLLAVCLTLWHMTRTWPTVGTTAQRLRYLALLAATVTIASGSSAQLAENSPVSGRNIDGLLVAVLAIIAAGASLWQDKRQHR